MSVDTPDLARVKEVQQRMWASGDFAAVATTITIVSELLCERIDLRAGQAVLDIATGSGNTAIAAARRGCVVTGIDFVPSLLARARERAACERLTIDFQAGDAERVPFPDGSFDVVTSTFGLIFAPDQARAASELVRVCRSGGKIGLAAWTPDSLVGESQRVMMRFVPPPPGLDSPLAWGTEDGLQRLLGSSTTSISVVRREFVFRFRSVSDYLTFQRTNLGPMRMTFERLDAAGQQAMAAELGGLAERFNRSGDATVAVPSAYLEVVATRR